MDAFKQARAVEADQGSEKMLAPLEVQKMLALKALGWGSKRISEELGCSRNTVREYLRQGGWKPMDVSGRASVLEPHREWLAERLRRHRGNADVVRQDLERELGVAVALRTVQRAVEPVRREMRADAFVVSARDATVVRCRFAKRCVTNTTCPTSHARRRPPWSCRRPCRPCPSS